MSEQPNESFGEQLIRSQSFSPSGAEKYRREMQALLERRLSTPRRWLHAGTAVLYLALAAFPLFIRRSWESVPLLRWLLLASSIMFLVLAAWFLWVAIRGRYNRRNQSSLMLLLAILVCGVGGLAMLEQAWAFEDAIARRRLTLSGITLLLFLGGTILVTFIEELHRRTEERLMRIEYRLAELTEKLERPSSNPAIEPTTRSSPKMD